MTVQMGGCVCPPLSAARGRNRGVLLDQVPVSQDNTPHSRSGLALALLAAALTILAGLLFMTASGPGAMGQSAAPKPPPSAGVDERLGISVTGAEIIRTRFGTGDRKLLVVGGVHGDEYGADLAQRLVDSLRADPSLVPAGTIIDVIVCLNPDGRASGTRGNARSVDINRNLPAEDWAAQLDPRDVSAKEGLTGGPSAGSEPETQALLTALRTGYGAVLSLHSSGGLIDYDGPGAETLARTVSAASGLPIKHLEYQPYIRGSMGRYLAETGTPLITIESSTAELDDGLRSGMLSVLGTP